MSELTVTIFSHKYRLAVSTGEEELLERCAKIVDDQMNAVRAGGKVISADQIAVLSALEIAYEAEKRRSESAGCGEPDWGGAAKERRAADRVKSSGSSAVPRRISGRPSVRTAKKGTPRFKSFTARRRALF